MALILGVQGKGYAVSGACESYPSEHYSDCYGQSNLGSIVQEVSYSIAITACKVSYSGIISFDILYPILTYSVPQ